MTAYLLHYKSLPGFSHVVCFSNAISPLQHSIAFLDLDCFKEQSAASCFLHSGSVGLQTGIGDKFPPSIK